MDGESVGLLEGDSFLRVAGELVEVSDMGSLSSFEPASLPSFLSLFSGVSLEMELSLGSSGGGLDDSGLEMMGEMALGDDWLLFKLLLRSISTKVGKVLRTTAAGERNIRLGEAVGVEAV
jgi:hypothetical protein